MESRKGFLEFNVLLSLQLCRQDQRILQDLFTCESPAISIVCAAAEVLQDCGNAMRLVVGWNR